MPKHWDLAPEDVLPADWTDSIQEFIGNFSNNFRLRKASKTAIKVEAGEDADQVAIGIGGKWRYRTEKYELAINGAKGTKTIWVVAVTANDFTGAGFGPDETDYDFELRATTGAEPEEVAYAAKVGEVDWSGSEIEAIRQTHEPVTGAQLEDEALNDSSSIKWEREPSGAMVPKVKEESISTALLEALAVTAAKIAESAVTEPKIAALAVATAKLAEEAVTTAKLENLAVTAAKLANEAAETGKIKNLAITAAKLAASAVEEAKIKDGAVTSRKAKLTAGVVSTAENLTLTTSYQDVPGATLEITPAVASILKVTAFFDLDTRENTIAVGSIKVDAKAEETIAARVSSGISLDVSTDLTQRAVTGQVWTVPLTAAAHTVKMRVKREGSGASNCYWVGTRFLYELITS